MAAQFQQLLNSFGDAVDDKVTKKVFIILYAGVRKDICLYCNENKLVTQR